MHSQDDGLVGIAVCGALVCRSQTPKGYEGICEESRAALAGFYVLDQPAKVDSLMQ